ncbi:MAG: T9SS type A sorting domain-containing protein [Candidatus Kapaibacterium sp.]
MLNSKTILTLVIAFVIKLAFAGSAQASVDLVSPTDLSECQPLSVDLVWEPAPNAVDYGIEVVKASDLSPVVTIESGLNSTTFSLSGLEYNTEYRWGVIANYGPDSIQTSNVWSFETLPTPPEPAYPEDDLTCAPKEIEISWQANPNADSYTLQIATDRQFGTIIQNLDDLSSNTFTSSVPFYGTQYWWRVRADMSECNSGFSEPRSFTTKTTPPVPLDPANDNGGVDLETTLRWGTVAGANFYNLMVDDDADFSSPIYDLSGLNSTQISATFSEYNNDYYWRVQAVENACVSEWSQTFSFTTRYEAPEVVYPADGEVCVSQMANFRWEAATGAGLYRLQIADDANFDNIIYEKDEIGDVSHSAPLPSPLANYYWRVRAEDDGNIGYYSEPAMFTTGILPPDMITPEDSTYGVELDMTFEWTDIEPGTIYHVQLAENPQFNPMVFDMEMTDQTELDYTLGKNDQDYFWRVSATFSGCASTWSQLSYFRTIVGIPDLIAPEDESIAQPINMLFRWSDVSGAEYYDLQIATDADFDDIIDGKSNVPATSVLIYDLPTNTKLYWRVHAKNEYGIGKWSETYEFTTGVRGPETPVLIYPEHRDEMVPVSLTFTWHEAARADAYTFALATDDDFETTIIYEDDIENEFFEVENLDYYATYYWKVRSTNDSGTSAWSDIRRFRTTALIPDEAPDLWTPLDGSDNLNPEVDFTWYPVPRAEYYQLQVATDPEFDSIVREEIRVYDTNETVFNLDLNTEYYWHVRAANEAGEGPWSQVWSFMTYDPAGVKENTNSRFGVNVFPHPVAGISTIEFTMPDAGRVNIRIYNSNGELVSTLLNGYKSEGTHGVEWDSESLESGAYIYSVISGNHSETGRIIIAK